VTSYAQEEAISHTTAGKLELPCPGYALIGECEEGHFFAKGCICNREWCEPGEGRCGGKDGAAHQRRKARWIPKVRKIGDMGRFVFTVPPERRQNYRTKEALGELGIAAKRMLQRRGYKRGLRRWHLFGEDHRGRQSDYGAPKYHPHLEVLVDGKWLGRVRLGAIKRSWANILKVPAFRINVYYEYIPANDVRRKLHRVGYALRPTFTDWRWDEPLAYEMLGFHNSQTWGSKEDWAGPDLWDIPQDDSQDAPDPVLEALEESKCPIDHTPITWGCPIKDIGHKHTKRCRRYVVLAHLMVEPGWTVVDGGYWVFNGDVSRPTKKWEEENVN